MIGEIKMVRSSLGAAALALALLPSVSSAAPITRSFEFQSTAGALLFGPTIGMFTYDDSVIPSVIPAGGVYVQAPGLFSDLSVSFSTFSFDETTANSGWLYFDAAGGLLEAHFGNSCGSGFCSVSSGFSEWWIRVGVAGSSENDFSYSGFNRETNFQTTTLNRLLPVRVPVSVPEPGSLALLGIALAGLAAVRRRGRKFKRLQQGLRIA